ncbi:hypothetical protein ABZ749_18610 [Micromonospora sp. NPDC047753]|uniref:hypothetical protein n=1 Tax=Micromonospora sp. NPDC047753 TaxID=3154817 RepID=UPI0033F7E196
MSGLTRGRLLGLIVAMGLVVSAVGGVVVSSEMQATGVEWGAPVSSSGTGAVVNER